MNCPIPVPPKIVTAAGNTLACKGEANVLTKVPVTDRGTGERGLALQYVCLHHSISIAVFKLIERLNFISKGNL
jgi:hypothetical protein